ncbi:hypothetical protein FAES_4001 [Fibrella aestuarina BUZ 2]|uniref:HEPN domain-containing protein n=1 Tax=Fibrella aestuarina BUZ 2 TaxID=1166018 RepID=I0KCZ9_9BACT|nr:hypothetical protein [Fibrella aestuarina]CCH02002.1 hypothetical protein FAES_4001 [Fibrella aestuarina BUZ 2]
MTERTFTAFTEADLLAGTRLCAANARTHSECADHIATLGHYGVAASHLVLAAEEAIKAFVFFAKLFDLPLPHKVDVYFAQHEPRHAAARDLYGFFCDLLASQAEYQTAVRQASLTFAAQQLAQGLPTDAELDEAQLGHDLMAHIGVELSRLLLAREARRDPDQEQLDRKWWNNANGLKNKGFYVDYYENKGWQLPRQVAEADYKDSRQRVDNVLRVIEELDRLPPESLADLKRFLAASRDKALEVLETSSNPTESDSI